MARVMDKKLLKKIKSFGWERWLERLFNPFILSVFKDGATKKTFNDLGFKNIEMEAFLYQNNIWYESKTVFNKMGKLLERYLENHTIFNVTASLDKFYKIKKKRIGELIENKRLKPEEKIKEVYEILTRVTSYIWLAHGLEHVYNKKLDESVPKYIKGDKDRFIGDAALPKKKTAHALMEEMILKRESPEKISKKFGWLKVRDGFSEPFTAREIRAIKVKKHKIKKTLVPKPLKKLIAETSELVYFRTRRTDILYEFMFLARPILKEIAKKYDMPFLKLKNYTIQSLIEGRPKKYDGRITCVNYKGNLFFTKKPVIIEKESLPSEVRGIIAQRGLAKGKVKIVKDPSELEKVKIGDVLVTQMTFPAFLPAMRRASAFVTDEGGITCHAAIVAREMKKPCIIGTKIATKVLKDGNYVEVDANKGIVKILNI